MQCLKELSSNEIEALMLYIKMLRKHNLSYSQIVQRVKAEKDVKISKATVIRWCKGTHSPFNRIKRLNLEHSPALSYIIGVYFGDGSITLDKNYKYKIKLKVADREFAEAFRDALKSIGANPILGFEKNITRSSRWYVEATSKDLFMFLKQPKEKLFKVAKEYPREFLRGFFDSEAYVFVDRYNPRRAYVSASNYDKKVLEFCQELLDELDIHSKIYLSREKGTPVRIRGKFYRYTQNFYELRIYRRKSVAKFTLDIGFTIQRKQEKLQPFLEACLYNQEK